MSNPSAKTNSIFSGVSKGLVGAAGVVAAAVWMPRELSVYLILLAAVVLIIILLIAYRLLLKWLASRKAPGFTDDVFKGIGNAPNSISSPASRAKLDDLRRNFKSGVEKFTSAGKDLYQLPWYVLIGEPGSGKTEAIRHSGIPFPPGLQDHLQGAGGTVNMNWWFTNEAVILDTAGKYIFEEVQPGASSEWTTFLELLVQNRPQCPINGLILVIPANSLILDTSDKIEAKAGKIAQQLDRIQRTLDVRFPVFVIVTKCDLINGFREFFDGLNQQRQQHQILGWSNPAPLDQPFNPELVDEHLKTVHTRLMQRRMGLLLDPVARESADERRINEVDALYSLPDTFVKIGPRLRHYLEMIFVAGEWSPKPLFLRGIYFTSSMREGQALDKELADLLDVPIDSLNEGRMWDRDRAFFLRDLFVRKMFKEKGLVTRAANTKQVERHRKVAMLAAALTGGFALLGFTWAGKNQLEQSVIRHATAWAAFEPVDFSIIKDGNSKTGNVQSRLDEKVPLADGKTFKTIGELHKELFEQQSSPVTVPIVLRPTAGIIDRSFHSRLNTQPQEVYQKIFIKTVLAPLIDATGRKLKAENAAHTWSKESTEALGELIRARAMQQPDLGKLFTYVTGADGNRPSNYGETFNSGLATIKQVAGAWPSPVKIDEQSIDAGVDGFIAFENRRISESMKPYEDLTIADKGEPAKLMSAEKLLADACDSFATAPPSLTENYLKDVQKWDAAWTKYDIAFTAVSKKIQELANVGGKKTSFVDSIVDSRAAAIHAAKGDYNNLLAYFPPALTKLAAVFSEGTPPALASIHDKIQRSLDSLNQDHQINSDVSNTLKKYDEALLSLTSAAPDGATAQFSVEAMHQMYTIANSAIPRAAADGMALTLPAAGKSIDDLAGRLPAKTDVDKKAREQVVSNCNIVLDLLVGPKLNFDALDRSLADNNTAVERLVELQSEKIGKVNPSFTIPFTKVDETIPPERNPEAVTAVLRVQQDMIKKILTNCDTGLQTRQKYPVPVPYALDREALKAGAAKRQKDVGTFVTEYVKYYRSLIVRAQKPLLDPQPTWSALLTDVLPHHTPEFSELNDSLALLGNATKHALKDILPFVTENITDKTPDDDDYRLLSKEITLTINEADIGVGALAAQGDKWLKVGSHWRNANADASAARASMIGMKAEDFAQEYLVPAKAHSYSTQYWSVFTVEMLRVLSNTQDAEAAKVIGSPEIRKFPLNLTSAKWATPQELDDFRVRVEGIRIPTQLMRNVDNKADVAIEKGGRVNAGDDQGSINEELDKLVGGRIDENDWTRLRNLKTLLDAITRANAIPFKCEISVPNQKDMDLKGAQPLSLQYSRVQIAADGNNHVGNPSDLNNGGKLADVLYPQTHPLENIRFAFWPTPAAFNANAAPIYFNPGKANVPWPDPGDPWGCLRYLQDSAQLDGPVKDGTVWNVTLTMLGPKNAKYSLIVQFKFEKALPPLDKWPR